MCRACRRCCCRTCAWRTARTQSRLKQASLDSCCSAPISPENELTVLHQLASHLQTCLSRSPTGPHAHCMTSFTPILPLQCAALHSVSCSEKATNAPPGISAAIKSCTLSQLHEESLKAQHNADLLACDRRYRTTAEEDEATIASSISRAATEGGCSGCCASRRRSCNGSASSDLFLCRRACHCKTGVPAHSPEKCHLQGN